MFGSKQDQLTLPKLTVTSGAHQRITNMAPADTSVVTLGNGDIKLVFGNGVLEVTMPRCLAESIYRRLGDEFHWRTYE